MYIKGQTIQGPKEGQTMTYKRLHGKLNIEQPWWNPLSAIACIDHLIIHIHDCVQCSMKTLRKNNTNIYIESDVQL